MQWQPIETFPKDGEKYMVWSEEEGIIWDAWYGWDEFRGCYNILYDLPYYDGGGKSIEPVDSPTFWVKISPPIEQ